MKILKLIVSGLLKIGTLLLIVFGGAGRIDYWQGWGLTALMLITAITGIIFFHNRSDLLKERFKPGPGMKWWDKVFWFFNIVLYFAVFVIGVLDGGRFGWTESIPLWGYILSYIGYLAGMAIVYWGMWTNDYFSSVVRIQKDRGHKVITDGPYKIVRHPGYVGASMLMLVIGPVLGSLWAMIPGGLWIISIIIRTYMEDKTLMKELEGYKEYAKKTRFRLIPGIWAFLISLTLLAGCSQPVEPVEWLTYEGPWFDIEYPSNFEIQNESLGYSEDYNGAWFMNKEDQCIFYVFSPQWAETSDVEEPKESETLLSEKIENNVTIRRYLNNELQFINEKEIIVENEGTVKYMFAYSHPVESDNCREKYKTFKDSIVQYAD